MKAGKTRNSVSRGIQSLSLPLYVRETRRLEVVLLWLYPKETCISDFDDALSAVFGQSVCGLSAATISQLKAVSAQDNERVIRVDIPPSGIGPP